jgi:hypothetical protein
MHPIEFYVSHRFWMRKLRWDAQSSLVLVSSFVGFLPFFPGEQRRQPTFVGQMLVEPFSHPAAAFPVRLEGLGALAARPGPPVGVVGASGDGAGPLGSGGLGICLFFSVFYLIFNLMNIYFYYSKIYKLFTNL